MVSREIGQSSVIMAFTHVQCIKRFTKMSWVGASKAQRTDPPDANQGLVPARFVFLVYARSTNTTK